MIGQKGEGHGRLVTGLRFHGGKIDGARVYAGGRAGLEAAQGEAQIGQAFAQSCCGQQPLRAALPLRLTDEDFTLQIYARAYHGGAAGNMIARFGYDCADAAPMGFQTDYLALADGQMILSKERALHALLVFVLIGLRAQGMHSRAFAAVEHAALQGGIVDGAAHFAAQCVHLAHQMSLARAADGGVAGHQGYRIQIEGKQQRFAAHARAGKRSLAARVARADYDDIIHVLIARSL